MPGSWNALCVESVSYASPAIDRADAHASSTASAVKNEGKLAHPLVFKDALASANIAAYSGEWGRSSGYRAVFTERIPDHDDKGAADVMGAAAEEAPAEEEEEKSRVRTTRTAGLMAGLMALSEREKIVL